MALAEEAFYSLDDVSQTLDEVMETGEVLGCPDRRGGIDPFEMALRRLPQVDPHTAWSNMLSQLMYLGAIPYNNKK